MNQLPRRALSRYGLTFQGKLTSGKLVLPDAHPCPAHALHLTRGELLNHQPSGG
ncbi:hypothetical protein [Escherichia coli]|uniref:hypothetical protein n=1 Tax=Escherichia coli TaxID=562 RepID=UPI0019262D6F|nr:hypothetical protein [Escherichia coli]EIQ0013734.1 hypothetical protein [Escherichia coli]